MKKKLLAIVLALALVSGLAFAMTACGGKGKFTVTFDANAPAAATAAVSGLPDKIEGVKKNAEIAEPAAKPALTGYDFGGWYKEAACTNAWSFTTDKVTASVTLYAKWTVKTTPAVTLAVPTGLSITSADVEDDNVYTLSWTAVENASGYTVGVGTAEHQVNAGESLDLTALELAAGVYDVRVLAKGNGTAYLNSAYSAVVRHYQGTEGLIYAHNQSFTETWLVSRGGADMNGKTVVVASHYKGKFAESIASGFAGQYQSTSATGAVAVVLPEGITFIGVNSFSNCVSLTSVVVPATVITVTSNAFNGCNALGAVYYGGADAAAWGDIDVQSNNAPIANDTIRYYYSETEPAESGKYWHWVNGVPTIWA